jgi:hypothetical protein
MPDPNRLDLDPVPVRSVRGLRGSVFAVATSSEISYYNTLMDSGLPEETAFNRLLESVTARTSLASGTYKAPPR